MNEKKTDNLFFDINFGIFFLNTIAIIKNAIKSKQLINRNVSFFKSIMFIIL